MDMAVIYGHFAATTRSDVVLLGSSSSKIPPVVVAARNIFIRPVVMHAAGPVVIYP